MPLGRSIDAAHDLSGALALHVAKSAKQLRLARGLQQQVTSQRRHQFCGLRHRQHCYGHRLVEVVQSFSSARPASRREPQVAIVVSVTPNLLRWANFLRVRGSMRCYARIHNYTHLTSVVLQGPGGFLADSVAEPTWFTLRWQRILQWDWLWAEHDWIVATDADVVPVNYSKPLVPFLEVPGIDVHLHLRPDTVEPTAAFVGLRGNSVFARSFLRRWVALGSGLHKAANFDNGDLLQVLLEHISPNDAIVCSALRPRVGVVNADWGLGYGTFRRCFARAVFRCDVVHHDGPGLRWGSLPVLLHRFGEGLLMQWMGEGNGPLYENCWGFAAFLHGSRHFGTELVSDAEAICDLTVLNQGGNIFCRWLGPEQERLLSEQCCLLVWGAQTNLSDIATQHANPCRRTTLDSECGQPSSPALLEGVAPRCLPETASQCCRMRRYPDESVVVLT